MEEVGGSGGRRRLALEELGPGLARELFPWAVTGSTEGVLKDGTMSWLGDRDFSALFRRESRELASRVGPMIGFSANLARGEGAGGLAVSLRV